jgi:hypothetical protein
MINLINAMDMASEFIQNTWVAVVRGDNQVPGAPALRFDNINQRNRYADSIIQGNAIDIPEAGQFNRKILATDPISDKTEEGYISWDMKPMLLGGPKARVSKKGNKYNIIPFRHGTDGGSGENAQFKTMPKDIYAAARKMMPSSAGTNGKLLYGGKLAGTNWDGKHPAKSNFIGRRDSTFPVPLVQGRGIYKHKSNIFDGMLKIESTYEMKTQNKYLTFRIVSDKSHPLSWWHPGRNAQPHMQFVIDHCIPKIERELKSAAQRDFLVFQGVGMDITVN